MILINQRLRLSLLASVILVSLSTLVAADLRAEDSSTRFITERPEQASEHLSDGKDNGGNLSFDEVRKQVIDIQNQLRLELFIARTTLSMGDLPSPHASVRRFENNELISIEALDRVIESFEDAKIIPTTQKLSVETTAEDGIETVRVTVDAINNSQRYDIQINVYSWALLGWCKKAQLVLHEHMGLENVEKSLNYNHSAPLAAHTSFCREN